MRSSYWERRSEREEKEEEEAETAQNKDKMQDFINSKGSK